MNYVLMHEIVKHIFANLVIIPSNFIDVNKTNSLRDKKFLLHESIKFETDDGKEIKNKVWACQLSAEQQELKMLLGDCTHDSDIAEYCLLVQLKNSPAYGLYLIFNDNGESDEPMIACTFDGKSWMQCNTYLQATFLAGMENLKDLGLAWNKCSDYKVQFELMLSFIEFYEQFYEDQDAGQESK
jgi:hypothetical protein